MKLLEVDELARDRSRTRADPTCDPASRCHRGKRPSPPHDHEYHFKLWRWRGLLLTRRTYSWALPLRYGVCCSAVSRHHTVGHVFCEPCLIRRQRLCKGHDSDGACRWQHMAALDEACQISVENQIFALLSDDLLLHLSLICRSSLLFE